MFHNVSRSKGMKSLVNQSLAVFLLTHPSPPNIHSLKTSLQVHQEPLNLDNILEAPDSPGYSSELQFKYSSESGSRSSSILDQQGNLITQKPSKI